MVIMSINYPRIPDKVQNMNIQRYISHLKIDCELYSDLIKGCWVLEEIPGAGFSGWSGLDPFPQHICLGMLAFNNMEDAKKFLQVSVPMQADMPEVGDVFAYIDYYELHTFDLPPVLESWEQKIADSYR